MRLRSEDVTWEMLDDELMVLDSRTMRFLRVNSSGAVLLRALCEDVSFDDLVSTLVVTFGISASVAAMDVRAFLGSLQERDLLVSDDTMSGSGR